MAVQSKNLGSKGSQEGWRTFRPALLASKIQRSAWQPGRESLARSLTLAFASWLCLGGLNVTAASQTASGQGSEPSAAAAATAKAVGTIKSISGNTITLTTDTGSEASVQLQGSTRMVRLAPGQKNLKDATPIQVQDLQAGDRMLARGTMAGDGKSVMAVSAVVMKGADVAAKKEQDREDWQKRGVGGLVKAIDPARSEITISVMAGAEMKTVAVQVAGSTVIRRYAPDSVKFDDAKPGTLADIKPGDQLRARGTRSADGSELAAEEIVSGTFRNIAGTVIAADPATNTIKISDVLTKKPVMVKVSSDSQLRKLPPFVAQRLAMRLKGGSAGAAPGAGAPSNLGARPAAADAAPGNGGEHRGSGSPDFQQMLARMPAVNIPDLQKGDAVMIVTTEGSQNSEPTVITLLTGVDAILTASPNGSGAAQLLSPWNLGGAGGGDAGEGATQ
jgi:hypothetical protein